MFYKYFPFLVDYIAKKWHFRPKISKIRRYIKVRSTALLLITLPELWPPVEFVWTTLYLHSIGYILSLKVNFLIWNIILICLRCHLWEGGHKNTTFWKMKLNPKTSCCSYICIWIHQNVSINPLFMEIWLIYMG